MNGEGKGNFEEEGEGESEGEGEDGDEARGGGGDPGQIVLVDEVGPLGGEPLTEEMVDVITKKIQ